MDPEEEEYVPAEELRRRGARVLTLDPEAIEGDPEAEARREAVMARARSPEAAAATPDRGSLADLFSRLPEIIRTSPILPPAERAAAAEFLDSGEALPAHLASGVTHGWSDELTGGAAALPSALRAVLSGSDPEAVRETRRAYERTRDRERARLARTREESPGVSLAGDVLGAGATAALPGGLPVDAALGALAGAGASDGEDMLGDTAAGGVLGAGTSAIGRVLGSAAERAAPAIRRQANEWRVASTGAGAPGMHRLVEDLGRGAEDPLNAAAEAIRESGIVPAIGTADTVAQNALRAARRVTPAEAAGAHLRVPRERLADALEMAATRGERSPLEAPMMARVREGAERMRARPTSPVGPLTEEAAGTLPFSAPGRPAGTAMHELDAMGTGSAWARPGEPTPTAAVYRDARHASRGVLDDVYREGLGDEALAEYRRARAGAETAIPILREAEAGANRSAAHRVGGLMTGVSGGLGAGIAHALGVDPVVGMGLGAAANAGLHNYGRTARATAGDAAMRATEAFAGSPAARSTAARGLPALSRIIDMHSSEAPSPTARPASPTAAPPVAEAATPEPARTASELLSRYRTPAPEPARTAAELLRRYRGTTPRTE